MANKPKNKPLLIIQLRPEDETSDNEFQAFLKYGQINASDVRRLRIEQQGIPADLNIEDYCGIIVGGSPFDISTPNHQKTAIQHKIESDFSQLLKRIIKLDYPFLGACSGNGLLGSYLGSPITGRYSEPVCCRTVQLTDAGRQDSLLKDFPETIDVLLGHKEACDCVPANATLLITGESCPVQMFRVGQNVYATQFHPEGDETGFILRINIYKHHGYFKPEQAGQLIDAVRGCNTPYAQEILRRFVLRAMKGHSNTFSS